MLNTNEKNPHSAALLMVQLSFCQSYDEQIGKAGEALRQKDFCNAVAIFQAAFKDSSKIGTYAYAYGAMAAANCNAERLALKWLKKSQQTGLGSSPGEIDFISADSGYVKLHSYPEWAELIVKIKAAASQKQQQHKKRAAEWVTEIDGNKLPRTKKGKFTAPKSGFALSYNSVDSLKVPYLVYVPKNYNFKKMQMVVYLHNGIVSTEKFNSKDPDLAAGEPIFSVGDEFNSIIVYPFGSKYFGWVAQKKAFENVLTIIRDVEQHYNVDQQRIFIGGMSNGGSATF